jgi:hypothetical protein
MSQVLLRDTLGWKYEYHVYSTYAASLYHTTQGDCDLALDFFHPRSERAQCHATAPYGESWGLAKHCPSYMSPQNATTTDSM